MQVSMSENEIICNNVDKATSNVRGPEPPPPSPAVSTLMPSDCQSIYYAAMIADFC